MKKITLKNLVLVAVACMTLNTVSAQQRVVTNTVSPKDLTAYNGQTIDLSIYRFIYKGWNTICLPVSLTTDEVNSIFGEECRLETLVGVENTGVATKLNFKDVKPDGLKANTPYILYSTLESGVREIRQSDAHVSTGPVELKFSDNTGTTVIFGGATEAGSSEGIYGILVKDNSAATFVDVSEVPNGILASRCFIKLNGGETSSTLRTNHLDYSMTGVEDVAGELTPDELTDVYNISGVKVASKVSSRNIRSLGKGVYVVKGRCFLVK